MKLLLITFSDNADHQETLFGMFEQLKEIQDVTLAAIAHPRVPVPSGGQVWLVDCPSRPGICRKTFHLAPLLRLLHRIRREKFEKIYFESLHVWNLPVLLFCGRHTRTTQVVHETVPHQGDRQAGCVNLMNRAVCALADRIVLRNRTFLPVMAARYGIPAERLSCLELWRRFPPWTPPAFERRILFFGRMNPYKGLDNLLSIVRLCPELLFDVVGRLDPGLKDLAEQLNKEPNVAMKTGYVSDAEMQRAFVKADWVIVPYNSASQSGVIIDAYRYSRPVIAFAVGAIPEQVEDGRSGYLIPEGCCAEFAERLKEVCKMPQERYEKMTHDAYEYGYGKYAACEAVPRFLKLMES